MGKQLSAKQKETRAKEKAAKEEVKQKQKEEKERAKADKDKEKERARLDKERAKAEKEHTRAAQAAEIERVKEERRLLRLETEKKKLQAEKEKNEKEKLKFAKLQEKKKEDRGQDRSRSLLQTFLGVTRPKQVEAAQSEAAESSAMPAAAADQAAVPSSAAASCSSSPAQACVPELVVPLFHPFQPKPNSIVAPLHRVPPATADDISYMDFELRLPSAPSTPPSLSSPFSSSAYQFPALSLKRRKQFHWSRHRAHSRRSKLVQHHTSPRPPWFGYFPLSSCAILPYAPFTRDPALHYDVDSDEEWGNEPDGEELDSGDEGEDDELLITKPGRIRADGYEEDGDFVVPEDEDEGMGDLAAQVEGKVMEKGGLKRVIIRPIILGPYMEGGEVTADLKELVKWSWRLMDGPIDVVNKCDAHGDQDKDVQDKPKKRGRKKRAADPSMEAQEPSKQQKLDGGSVLMPPNDAASAEDGEKEPAPSTAAGSPAPVPSSPAAGGVFTPQVKKKQRTVMPTSATPFTSISLAHPMNSDVLSPAERMHSTQLMSPAPLAPLSTPPSPPPSSSATSSVVQVASADMAMAKREGAGMRKDELVLCDESDKGEDVSGVESVLLPSELSSSAMEMEELSSELAVLQSGDELCEVIPV